MRNLHIGLLLLLCIVGCWFCPGSAATEELAEIERSAVFRQALEPCALRSVKISVNDFRRFVKYPEKLAARLGDFGINMLGVELDWDKVTDKEYWADCRNFVSAMKALDVICCWYVNEQQFFPRRNSNAFMRLFQEKDYPRGKNLELLQSFFRQCPVDGIILEFAAHRRSGGGEMYSWSSPVDGKQSDNEKLIVESLILAEEIEEMLPDVELTLIVRYDYLTQKGWNLIQSAADFENDNRQLIVASTGKNSEECLRQIAPWMSQGSDGKILAGVGVAGKSFGDRESLRRFSFGQFSRALEGIFRVLKEEKAFAGIHFSEYGNLESIWSW